MRRSMLTAGKKPSEVVFQRVNPTNSNAFTTGYTVANKFMLNNSLRVDTFLWTPTTTQQYTSVGKISMWNATSGTRLQGCDVPQGTYTAGVEYSFPAASPFTTGVDYFYLSIWSGTQQLFYWSGTNPAFSPVTTGTQQGWYASTSLSTTTEQLPSNFGNANGWVGLLNFKGARV